MIKYLNNQRGDILGFIIIAPIIVWFFLYIIFCGMFLLDINQMNTIVNKSLSMALVEGQFTTKLQSDLKNELINAGFTEDKLEINITPTYAGDNNDLTYATRGNIIEISVIFKKPHIFYYTNFKSGGESKYYIGIKMQGMSEKW